jgi:CRP/FNR family transcriptional regulator
MNSALTDLRQAAVINVLRQCQLFAGLPESDLSRISDITVVKSLDKDQYLFREGETSRGFFIVQKGAVNVHRVTPAGKEHVIHVFRPGESFAEATLGTLPGYPADARAVEPTQVLLVQKAEMIASIKRQPELALRMLGAMSLHLRTLVGQLEDLSVKDVETRMAHWLLKRCPAAAGDQPHTFELPMTKRMLAAELGTVSETFSRTLAKLRAQRLVEVKGRRVTIPSSARLTALLQRNLGA